MAFGERLQPGHGPLDPASPDDFPWARLVTSVFAVAMSLSASWRAERTPDEVASTAAAPPQQEQPAAADFLDRQQREIANASALRETLSQPAAPAEVAHISTRTPPVAVKRPNLQRTTTRAMAPSDVFTRRKAGVNPWSIVYQPNARARPARSRFEVRSEYLAAREQVAALAGEDSGSAYMARLAARQSVVRANDRAAHSPKAGQASRRTRARP